MIFKKAGNYKLHKLQKIKIMEANYTLTLGIFWRKTFHRAGDNNLLNNNQYGGRPGKTANDPTFIRI